MKTYKASDYGVKTGGFCEKELEKFLESIPDDDAEKIIEFENGDYLIDTANLKKRMLYITNTAGDREYSKEETPHLSCTPLYFGGLKNVTVEGNGARFVLHGKATNAVITDCENFKMKNLEITAVNPNLHEMKVIGKGDGFVDYEIDSGSEYEISGGRLYFTGKDYRFDAMQNSLTAWWNAHIPADNQDKISRVSHPLRSCRAVEETAPHKVRVTCSDASKFSKGDIYYIFDVRRQYAGIFVDRCKDITLEKIKQRFSYSLALVVQNTENVTVDSVEFAPEKDSGRLMCSVADFIQICMCRGQVTVKNSYFDGAGDDCLNVHGFHYRIVKKKGNKITVKYIHPQSHGFNPLRAGDEISFVNPLTLLECGRTRITASETVNEREICLTVENAKKAKRGRVIEDISACPDVIFSGNTYTRIITRGLLLTTRGKVVIENNRFISNTMSGILLSDDARSWYESGACRDVTVRNNIFDYCGENGILIKPENLIHRGAVHKNIKIIDNTFKKCEKACFYIKSTSDVELKGNDIGDVPAKLETKNVKNLKKDF